MKSILSINEYSVSQWKLPNGQLHREDGPAFMNHANTKAWYINGQLHREDGPAIEYLDGSKYWFLNDVEYNEKEYKYEIRSRKLKQLL
jgi:hypothetical protein